MKMRSRLRETRPASSRDQSGPCPRYLCARRKNRPRRIGGVGPSRSKWRFVEPVESVACTARMDRVGPTQGQSALLWACRGAVERKGFNHRLSFKGNASVRRMLQ
jgi:hypothetical protein